VISLYFHIPFCEKKCPYCHFYVIPNRASHRALLADALKLEWERELPKIQDKKIVSVYFGGGTPTLFPQISDALQRIPYEENSERTVEANPENGSLALFKTLKQAGFNRLSLGVQSLDDRSLSTLERTHSAIKAKEAIFQARDAGFTNISIDLMYDLPGQTESSWRYTLDQIADLPIQHLSLYNLTIEPHTSFYKRKVILPHEEESLRFLGAAVQTLEEIGLKRYEISAFAKPGFESRHNIGYWTGRPFLGFGPSAFSYWEGERFQNTPNLNRYAALLKQGHSPVSFREKLPYPKNVCELLAIRLRLFEGVDVSQIELPSITHKSLEKLIEKGWLVKEETRLSLSNAGRLFYDAIAEELI
jgi:oxygen-independent coproporphyrinogen-3 oxidase